MHWRTRAALFVLLSQENSRDRSGERVSRFPRQEMLLLVSRGSSFPVSKKQVRFLRETKKTVELISTRTNPNFSPLVTCTRGKINWRVFLDPWKRSNNKNTRSTEVKNSIRVVVSASVRVSLLVYLINFYLFRNHRS